MFFFSRRTRVAASSQPLSAARYFFLEQERSRLMSDEQEGVNRLFRAIEGLDSAAEADHEKYLAGLSSLVEAEMAGENIASLYPEILAHLDTCVSCGAEYSALLELAMAEARGEIPQPATFPPLRLPRPIAIQQLVRRIVEALLKSPDQLEDLVFVLQTFFEQVQDSPDRLTLEPTSALVMGLSGETPQSLPEVMSAYYGLTAVLERYSAVQLQALEPSALEQTLRQIAQEEVRRYDLRGGAEKLFVDTFVREVLASLSDLLKTTANDS
jgi:hypothetical protein